MTMVVLVPGLLAFGFGWFAFRSRVTGVYKLVVFTLSAVMAAIGGALHVPQVGMINPSEFAPANSVEAVIWVAVGGRGTLVGAALGAIIVNFGKTYFTGALLCARHPIPTKGRDRQLSGLRQPIQASSSSSRWPPMDSVVLTSSLLYLDGVSVSFDGYKALRSIS